MSSTVEEVADCTDHEWESVGNTERIDRTTVAVEYECLNCGKIDLYYYEIEAEQIVEEEERNNWVDIDA